MLQICNTEKIYSVLELNTTLRDLIKSQFPGYIWVCGEIQSLRIERDKKHTYFELVQKHSEAQEIIAKVRVALFENRKPVIFKRVQETNGAFELKNDIEVKFLCEVSLHPPTGQYSLIIVDVDPVYTLGKVAQNRLRIIEELKKQGLLDKNKTRPVPILPLNIGLVTAFDSAAYHDFIDELHKSGYGFKVFVYNAYMQGKNVESDVARAVQSFNGYADLDLIVITRGGGSKADLSWFDNKKIAEAVALSQLPVLSALGHQIDVSITDMVAYESFKTPTKVAQFVVDKIKEALDRVEDSCNVILEKADLLLQRENENLKTKTLKMDSLIAEYFRDNHEVLAETKSNILNIARHIVKDESRKVNESLLVLEKSFEKTFRGRRDEIEYMEGKIELLDPRNILKRGYSLTIKDNKTVKSISQLQRGDFIKTVYFDGRSVSEIKEIGEQNE